MQRRVSRPRSCSAASVGRGHAAPRHPAEVSRLNRPRKSAGSLGQDTACEHHRCDRNEHQQVGLDHDQASRGAHLGIARQTGATVEGLAVDQEMRWALITGLAKAGRFGDAEIDAELEVDKTIAGKEQAAAARVAQPTAEAKEAGWRAILDPATPNETSREMALSIFRFGQEDVLAYQKDAVIGHRPTWRMGFNGDADRFDAADPLDLIREFGPSATRARYDRERERKAESARPIHNAERRAFETLDLEAGASAGEIKARFKELVKRHHPDANGGDDSTEDRLVEIIQAYNYLKSAKFC